MIQAIIQLIKGLILKLFLPIALFIGLLLFAWTSYRENREARTLTLSFMNIDGLSKGAPVYVHGVKVGKVIQMFPVLNSNAVAVKILITDKQMPVPSYAEARIITSIETGGGKVIELQNLTRTLENHRLSVNGMSPLNAAYLSRLMLDILQLTKDFAEQGLKALGSRQADSFKSDLENQVKNTITSIEYGTVKKDVQNEVRSLNKRIRNTELDPANEERFNKNVKNQFKALQNTLNTLSDVSKSYQ